MFSDIFEIAPDIAMVPKMLGCLPRDIPFRKKWFFLSRFALNPAENARWFRFAAGRRAALGLWPPPRDLIEKPMRHYLRHGLGVRERVDLLLAHYALADRRLPPALSRALLSDDFVVLGALKGKGVELRLLISRSVDTRQEGEITIHAVDAEDGLRLAKLTFLLAGDADRPDLVIGGLQGLPPGQDKKRIVAATRRLSGLRPKAAVFAAAQSVARHLNAAALLAVSKALHPANEKSASYLRAFQADYDGFWAERGGTPDGRFGFAFPLDRTQAAESANAAALRRAQFLEHIDAMVARAVLGEEPARPSAECPRHVEREYALAAE